MTVIITVRTNGECMNKRQTARVNLVTASREWASRPADQRFWTLRELFDRSKKYAEESYIHKVELSGTTAVAQGGDLVLDIGTSDPATFQHYSFGQLCNIAGAPAGYLRGLPAGLAAENLNHGLSHTDGEQVLMLHKNGDHVLRCVTSNEYSRIWNYEVAEMALALEEGEGWMTPPARPCGIQGIPSRRATADDVLRKSAHPTLGIEIGDEISPAGLYASDHDCFIFQVNEDHPIDAGGGEMLYRGVFWKNSEVGDARFTGTMFLYDTICGNHIVWGAKVIAEISIPHRGNAKEIFREAMAIATHNALAPASEDENRIKRAKLYEIGPGQPEVIKTVFTKFSGYISKRECEDAYVMATRHAEDHNTEPNTAWGYASGITRLSQGQHADSRDRLDRVAGRVLEMALVR